MPAPPKFLITLGASILTTRAALRLRQKGRDLKAQDRHFAALMAAQANTAFGRDNGIEKDLAYPRFQKRVPLRSHQDFVPWIERMKTGEADALRPGRCNFYATSAGTTGDPLRELPVTAEMLAHYRQAGLDSLLYYTARTGHTGVFSGKHLFLGGSTSLRPLPAADGHVAYSGDLGGITTLNLPAWVEKHIYEPGPEIARMADWPAKLAAIAARTRRSDITLLAGIPGWTLHLAELLLRPTRDDKVRPANLQALWPNLECLVHGGVPLGPFADELRDVLGSRVRLHEVYPTTAGFIAAQDDDASAGLRLMADAGLHFEFLPLEHFDEARLASLGPRTVPLAGVRAGVNYVLVLNTPAGLTRYVVGDIVRFTSTAPHRLVHAGRTRLRLDSSGEQVLEKELTDALTNVCRRHQWRIVNFHVASILANSLVGSRRGHHEWWIELKPLSMATPTGPVIATEIDTELRRLCPAYTARRTSGDLAAPVVRLVMPGVFELWQRKAGKWGGEHKMPRCRGDRQIADQLADITRFSADS